MKWVGCGWCGALIGRADTETERAAMLREHRADCEKIS